MSPLLRWLTIGLVAIPVAFVVHPIVTREPSPLLGLGLLLAALYAAVWIWWRPSRFEVNARSLHIVFPGRSREVPLIEVSGCRTFSRHRNIWRPDCPE